MPQSTSFPFPRSDQGSQSRPKEGRETSKSLLSLRCCLQLLPSLGGSTLHQVDSSLGLLSSGPGGWHTTGVPRAHRAGSFLGK